MKAHETLIAWDRKMRKAAVGPWPDYDDWSDDYLMTGGACFTWYHDENRPKVDTVVLDILRMFIVMVVGGIPPVEAYAALYQIDEFRDHIPHDMPTPEQYRQQAAKEQ